MAHACFTEGVLMRWDAQKVDLAPYFAHEIRSCSFAKPQLLILSL